MKKNLFLALIFGVCFGRENPFVPTGELNSSVATTNVTEILSPFEKQNIKLPSETKDLISISLKYRNASGDIKEKVIDVNKSVDWQDDFMLIKMASPEVVAKPDVSVTKDEPKIAIKPIQVDLNLTAAEPIKEQKIDENVTEDLKEVIIIPIKMPEDDKTLENIPIHEHNQTQINHNTEINTTSENNATTQNITAQTQETKSVEFKNIKFNVSPMQIEILTNDAKIRDFAVSKEQKIVIDFKSKINFSTKSFQIDCGAFKSVTFGDHDGFYRATINLDGKYKYSIKDQEGGYILKLNRQ